VQKLDLQLADKINLRGKLHITVHNVETGEIEQRIIDNVVVKTGKQRIAELMLGLSNKIFNKIGVGSDNTTPTEDDTALGSQIGDKKTCTVLETTGADNSIARSRTFFGTQENNGTWREAGWFTEDNVMLARALISPEISKTSAKTVTLKWEVTVG